jgi:hypothetical protein
VEQLRARAGPPGCDPAAPEARPLAGLSVEAICAGVAAYHGLEPSDLGRLRGGVEARSAAAWLCRRYTEAPLRELAGRFGLSRAGSVSNLTRRVEARLAEYPTLAAELAEIMRQVAHARRAGESESGCHAPETRVAGRGTKN